MRELEPASQVPTKTRDENVAKLFNSCLTLSKAFALFILVERMHVEKIRDDSHRLILVQSGAQCCLNSETLDTILEADHEERNAYLIG
jgi:hypothetical protein